MPAATMVTASSSGPRSFITSFLVRKACTLACRRFSAFVSFSCSISMSANAGRARRVRSSSRLLQAASWPWPSRPRPSSRSAAMLLLVGVVEGLPRVFGVVHDPIHLRPGWSPSQTSSPWRASQTVRRRPTRPAATAAADEQLTIPMIPTIAPPMMITTPTISSTIPDCTASPRGPVPALQL